MQWHLRVAVIRHVMVMIAMPNLCVRLVVKNSQRIRYGKAQKDCDNSNYTIFQTTLGNNYDLSFTSDQN